jgi:hypothetical protein
MDGTLDFDCYSLLGGKCGYNTLKNTPTQSNFKTLMICSLDRRNTKYEYQILKPKIILPFFGFFNQTKIVILFICFKLTKKVCCFLGNSAFLFCFF